MSKRNLGSKLKMRLDEWEAYGEKPVLVPEPVPEHDVRRQHGTMDPDFTECLAAVQVSGTAREGMQERMEPIVLPEARVDELKVAVHYETDQSRYLVDEVEREQVFHAVAHRSQKPDSAMRGAREPVRWQPERPQATYRTVPQTAGSPHFMLIILALLIGVLSCGVVYLLIH